MATPLVPAPLSLEQLLEAVDHLSPAQRLEFERRLAARGADHGHERLEEANLIRSARILPVAADRRLKKLIARSERGSLTEKELVEYQALAEEVQRIDAVRAEALAELARRRGKSVRAVKAELDREGGTDGA
jgi:hypothetical protein